MGGWGRGGGKGGIRAHRPLISLVTQGYITNSETYKMSQFSPTCFLRSWGQVGILFWGLGSVRYSFLGLGSVRDVERVG